MDQCYNLNSYFSMLQELRQVKIRKARPVEIFGHAIFVEMNDHYESSYIESNFQHSLYLRGETNYACPIFGDRSHFKLVIDNKEVNITALLENRYVTEPKILIGRSDIQRNLLDEHAFYNHEGVATLDNNGRLRVVVRDQEVVIEL